MIAFFANIFGYLLNFLYNIFQNYCVAIIVFSVVIKLILLPLSIKQSKTMKKTNKIQQELKSLQVKYKNNPEQLNKETMQLYKRENMSPFSGCFSAIIQLILLFAVFYLVRSPLTYMRKIDSQIIENYKKEISIENTRNTYPEIKIIQKKGTEDSRVYINMEFLGLDLSSVPTQNTSDWKVFIIPALYITSSIVSMKITTNMQTNKNKEVVIGEDGTPEVDPMEQANKSMSYFMPVMLLSVAAVAPLGLALYWLVNNILMTVERLALNKFLKDE